MSPTSTASRLLLAAACLAPAAAQTTYVVDDSGGAGVDFTDIQSALNVAGPFDLVEVRPGSYSAFVMSNPTRVVGSGSVMVAGMSRVRNIFSGEWTMLAGLSLDRCTVEDCSGVVLFDDLKLGDGSPSLLVRDSDDVRALTVEGIGSFGFPSLEVQGSRLQLVEAAFGDTFAVAPDQTNGKPAARITGDSFVHAVQSSFHGEWGGYGQIWGEQPGDGGNGMEVYGGARVRLDNCTLKGGLGGLNSSWPGSDGFDGRDFRATDGEHLLWSCTGSTSLSGGATVDSSTHVPSFLVSSAVQTGQLVTLSVRGKPTGSGRILFGRFPVTIVQPATQLERLVDVGRLASLGAMPATGERPLQFVIPTTWPAGTVVFLQTSSTESGGVTDLSNAIALLVR